MITVTAVSNLAGTVYFHWWIDGVLIDTISSDTGSSSRPFAIENDEQARIDVADTTDPNIEPTTLLPFPLIPRRINVQWTASLGQVTDDVGFYEVEILDDDPPNDVLFSARIPAEPARWVYSWLSPRLDFAARHYDVKIHAYDRVANKSVTSVTLEYADFLVGLISGPEAPAFTVTFDSGTDRVTFHAA